MVGNKSDLRHLRTVTRVEAEDFAQVCCGRWSVAKEGTMYNVHIVQTYYLLGVQNKSEFARLRTAYGGGHIF